MTKTKLENKEEVSVATTSKIFEGVVVAKTAKSANVLEIIVEVSGNYNDFELNDKIEIKK